MKEISLTKGTKAMVDDDVFEELKQHKWMNVCGYAARRNGGSSKHSVLEYMHRRIVQCPKGMEVDHINRHRLDNRRENLRICTRQQNMVNKVRTKRKNKNGFVGITRSHNAVYLPWFAVLHVGGKYVHIGGFKTKEQAALVYDLWMKDMHKEYAVTNFASVPSVFKGVRSLSNPADS